MSRSTLPLSFRRPEGRALRGFVPGDFEAFYRARLRYITGGRVRSSVLARSYQEWAANAGAGSLGYKEIRRAMENIGHRHLMSDGAYYRDVAFAEAVPNLPDNYPDHPSTPTIDGLLQWLDQVAADLAAVRAEIALTTHQAGAK